MQIMVGVVLDTGDQLSMTLDDMASAILTAVNGDPAKDTVMVSLREQPQTGQAGAVEPPPSP